jgi:hypothetical protein
MEKCSRVRNSELEAQIWSRNEPKAEDFERFFDDIQRATPKFIKSLNNCLINLLPDVNLGDFPRRLCAALGAETHMRVRGAPQA